MQHPPTDKIQKRISNLRKSFQEKGLNPVERYAANKQAQFDRITSDLDASWFAPFPLVNPFKIIEHSKTSPMSAAFMCQRACAMIANLEKNSIREYVAAAYSIACDMKSNERAIEHLASDVQDGRYKKGVPIEVVKEDLLHYLFLYIFYQSGVGKRDRATQYAQGLKEYFYEGRPPNIVGATILKHGPDRLRRVAQRKAKLIEGAQDWAKQGKDPVAPPFDEVLAMLAAEETKAAPTDEPDESFDHGSRDLPPDLSDDEDSEFSDDDEHGPESDQGVELNGASERQTADVAAEKNTATGNEVDARESENAPDEARLIDGDVIDERLQQILFGTMSLGASLVTQPLDRDVKKHVIQMTIQLSNDLLSLRRMINGV